jgi:hypothetical protein
MNTPHPDPIWLILPLLAVSFLLWVLWNFRQEERRLRRGKRAARPQPRASSSDCADLTYAASATTTVIRRVKGTSRAINQPLGRSLERIARS